MKKIIIIFLLIPMYLYPISDAMDNTTIYNKGLGGPHTSMVKGFNSFYNNPALLGHYKSELSLLQLDANLKGDAIEMLNLYLGGKIDPSDLSTLITLLNSQGLLSPLFGINLPGPISLGYIDGNRNWGLRLHNISTVHVDVPGLLNTAEVVVREDFVVSAGIAIPLTISPRENFYITFTPGVMARTTIRAEIKIEKDLLGVLSYAEDPISVVDDFPIYLSPMFALDLGFTIDIANILMLSGVVKDIYTPILRYPVSTITDATDIFTTNIETSGSLVYREINMGMGINIPLGPLRAVISDLDVYIDYYDLLILTNNPLLHLGAGLDLTLLDKFHLLAGFNQGLLSLGLNVDLKGFSIGFAMYGTEEGSQPGLRPLFNFVAGVGVSF